MKPRDAIRWLGAVRERVDNREGFFALHASEWTELATETARLVLLANTPADRDAETWAKWADRIAESVGSQLVTAHAAGILIFAGRRDPSFDGDFSGVVFSDVVAYVAAGRNGDPLGKADFTEADRLKTDDQVAMNIWESLQNGNPDRLDAVLAHVGDRLGGEARELFQAILQTWKEVFSVKARRDFRRWVRRQV